MWQFTRALLRNFKQGHPVETPGGRWPGGRESPSWLPTLLSLLQRDLQSTCEGNAANPPGGGATEHRGVDAGLRGGQHGKAGLSRGAQCPPSPVPPAPGDMAALGNGVLQMEWSQRRPSRMVAPSPRRHPRGGEHLGRPGAGTRSGADAPEPPRGTDPSAAWWQTLVA